MNIPANLFPHSKDVFHFFTLFKDNNYDLHIFKKMFILGFLKLQLKFLHQENRLMQVQGGQVSLTIT